MMPGDQWIEIPQGQRSGGARVARSKSSPGPQPGKAPGNAASRTSYVQDAFYQHFIAGRVPAEIMFLDGTTVVGLLDGFDTYAILLVVEDQEMLVFKSAVRAIRRYLGESRGAQNS